MTQFNGYLTEEVVEDYSDGIIDRREALRRLTGLGVAVAVAGPLLAACTVAAPAPPSSTAPAGPTAKPTEAITFPGAGRTVQGAWAAADSVGGSGPKGAVLVIHENRGLTDHIRSVAGRLATSGYSALAVDLLSEEGGTGSFKDEAAVTEALNKVDDTRFVADMKAGVSELQRRTPEAKIGAIGFCFGGGMVWSLLASGEPRLSAAAPFYGPLPDGADFSGSKDAAVLAFYGEQDERVNATQPAARHALETAFVTHKLVTFPGAGHAFFNDTGQRYNAGAATSAYAQLLDWFGSHLD